eukprot:CAMPEP_0183332798 /NCGR_PEP_ID=MMETSP0164_2-20130417/1873_1 /TAXON_ID=221442 /ORGANISM="Coccolithus pelagicus ssp braarudi, Strain PLY182g" /LENGTH=108 /DNA_ID=CAMNT_0025501593 /DNA_START=253 /DNA_END=579 /DNA_ORIENTATION=-
MAHNHTLVMHCCKHSASTANQKEVTTEMDGVTQHSPLLARERWQTTPLQQPEQYASAQSFAAATLIVALNEQHQWWGQDLRALGRTCHTKHDPRSRGGSARRVASTEA